MSNEARERQRKGMTVSYERYALVERVHGEVLAVYTDGYDQEVSDLYFHAKRIIALVEQDVARRLLSDGIDLNALRERYNHEFEIPKCHICGDEMSPGTIGQGRIEWSCYGKVEGGAWNEYKPGRSIGDQHCLYSHRVTVPHGDMEVVRLVDALTAIGIGEEQGNGITG